MSENDIDCPIWNTPATLIKEYGDTFYINSPRVGGKYAMANLAPLSMKKQIQKLDDATKARLTSWLIEQRLLGEESPLITPETIEDAKRRRDLSIYERADRLLRYLSHKEPSVGKWFWLERAEFLSAQAWLESKMIFKAMPGSIEELKFFVSFLKTKGWIEEGHPDGEYKFTVEGYTHLEELEHPATASSQGFVAMWFDDSMTTAWRDGIKPAIEDAGYEAHRIDQKEHVNKIDDEIIAEIRRSRFIVADFTHGDDGPRGGVYYEAGFAHGLGIPVIFTCRKDALEKVHFDTRQYNHIVWETPEELQHKLATRIAAVVGDGPHRNGDA